VARRSGRLADFLKIIGVHDIERTAFLNPFSEGSLDFMRRMTCTAGRFLETRKIMHILGSRTLPTIEA